MQPEGGARRAAGRVVVRRHVGARRVAQARLDLGGAVAARLQREQRRLPVGGAGDGVGGAVVAAADRDDELEGRGVAVGGAEDCRGGRRGRRGGGGRGGFGLVLGHSQTDGQGTRRPGRTGCTPGSPLNYQHLAACNTIASGPHRGVRQTRVPAGQVRQRAQSTANGDCDRGKHWEAGAPAGGRVLYMSSPAKVPVSAAPEGLWMLSSALERLSALTLPGVRGVLDTSEHSLTVLLML